MRTIILTVAGLSLVALHPAATQQPAAQPTAAPAAAPASPASQLGLYVFPSKDQTKDQQLADEQQCWAWAKDQTKIDPATLHANTDSAARAAQAKTDSATKGAAVGGAARGAGGRCSDWRDRRRRRHGSGHRCRGGCCRGSPSTQAGLGTGSAGWRG